MTDRLSDLHFTGGAKITGLPAGAASGEPVTLEQMLAWQEGMAWKDDVRAASTANINLSAPGTTIDGVTMTVNDRFLAKNQTTASENGVYIFNGSAVAATRATDMSSSLEFNAAVVPVVDGTANFGTKWRQTAINPTVGSTSIAFTVDGAAAPAASETTAGVAELATQAEVDAGVDTTRIVTTAALAASPFAAKRYAATIGDASNTSIAVTHNLGSRDVTVQVYKAASTYDQVECDIQRTSTTQVTLIFAAAPASNALRVVVTR